MRSLIVSIAALLLTACASAPLQTTHASLEPSNYEIDHAKIAMVERQARDRWGKVIWVSLPRKRVNEPRLSDN